MGGVTRRTYHETKKKKGNPSLWIIPGAVRSSKKGPEMFTNPGVSLRGSMSVSRFSKEKKEENFKMPRATWQRQEIGDLPEHREIQERGRIRKLAALKTVQPQRKENGIKRSLSRQLEPSWRRE